MTTTVAEVRRLTFWVAGIPRPGGSKRAFPIKTETGIRVAVTDANPNVKDWRMQVAAAAYAALRADLGGRRRAATLPVAVTMRFFLTRPKSHYRTGKNKHLLRDSAPEYPAGKPDVLKLARSTEDALTGILWLDDAQIVREALSKDYGAEPGAQIEIGEMWPRGPGGPLRRL